MSELVSGRVSAFGKRVLADGLTNSPRPQVQRRFLSALYPTVLPLINRCSVTFRPYPRLTYHD